MVKSDKPSASNAGTEITEMDELTVVCLQQQLELERQKWKRAKSFAEGQRGTHPDWRCRTCGCLWRDNADDSVSLYSAEAKSCGECELKGTFVSCEPLTMLALMTRLEYGDQSVVELQPPVSDGEYNRLSLRVKALEDALSGRSGSQR